MGGDRSHAAHEDGRGCISGTRGLAPTASRGHSESAFRVRWRWVFDPRRVRFSGEVRKMTIRSHGLKGVASIGLAAVICGALLSCSGPVGSPGGKAPDLRVTPPSVNDSGPNAGARFTLSATVRNAGDGAAAATTLRYYRSTDGSITRSDTEVGTNDVAALAASGTGRESVELVASSTPGAYYYGACVDAVPAETDATDNCSTSVKVTVQSHRHGAAGPSGAAGPRGDVAVGER